jgi:hypothetical protein
MVCNAQSYVSNKINMCRNVLCKPQEEEEEENDVASTPIVYCLFSPSLLCLIREGQVIFLRLLHKHASHRSKCRLCSGKHTFVTENQISSHYGQSTKIIKIMFSTNTNLFSTSITGLSAASGLIRIRCLPGTYYASHA